MLLAHVLDLVLARVLFRLKVRFICNKSERRSYILRRLKTSLVGCYLHTCLIVCRSFALPFEGALHLRRQRAPELHPVHKGGGHVRVRDGLLH